ncbi:MAG: class I SAM-dependent methyltransferase [Dermabacter sp.]|nr:class I SAM-dependent methyltransferase [Dermabacter sp.]
MASGKIASWAFGEEFPGELPATDGPDAVERARERGSALGVAPLLPGAATHLRTSAAMLNASSVVEVGTGTGVGSLHLLSGMAPDGVLTTIDPEPENHRVARLAFAEARVAPGRVRTIGGRPSAVLARLTPGAYDMVVLWAAHPEIETLTELARRLLRPGGVLIILNVLHHDRVADPTRRDETTARVRALLRSLASDESLVASLSPAGDGILTAVTARR